MKRLILVLACSAVVGACGDSATGVPKPASLAVTASALTLDAVGATGTVSASVLDDRGDVMTEAVITWTSNSPSVTVTTNIVTGVATVTAAAAGTAVLTARSGEFTGTVTVTVAPVPAAIARVEPDVPFAAVLTQVAKPLQVRVTDRLGAPVVGRVVAFTVTTGGGTLSTTTATTGADGVASSAWTLGPATGVQSVTAQVTGVTSAAGGLTLVFTTVATTPPASITLVGGNKQAALAGTAVPTAPSVLVRDASGNNVPGATVLFTVTGGGGTLTGASAVSNASGVATLGAWTLGALANPNAMTATLAGLDPSINVAFTAVGCQGASNPLAYGITVCFVSEMTATQRAAFEAAAAKWSTVITGDVPDVPLSTTAGTCGTNAPALNMVVDDLVIYATIEAIDGVGSVLGSAGWCILRSGLSFPSLGRMRFDIADMANLEANGRLGSVIMHEMGHVLGIGTSWSISGFLRNTVVEDGTVLDTHYLGPNAIAGFDAVGGLTYTGGLKVPVENNTNFGSGTINAHWRESVLANELMTGFISGTSQPMSVLTVRSLADLGYTVNAAAADPFFLTLALKSGSGSGPPPLDLGDDVDRDLARYWVDSKGRLTIIR